MVPAQTRGRFPGVIARENALYKPRYPVQGNECREMTAVTACFCAKFPCPGAFRRGITGQKAVMFVMAPAGNAAVTTSKAEIKKMLRERLAGTT